MKVSEIINKSYYGTSGYISSKEDIDKLEQYINYNFPVLNKFKGIIIATNFKEQNSELFEYLEKLFAKMFNIVYIYHSPVNRGHNFGTADLDNAIIDLAKIENIEWICKSDHDVILDPSLLDVEIPESDFYYINGIGFGGMEKYNFDFNKIINEDFYPQTYFYFINTSKIDYLIDKNFVDQTYEITKTIPNYNGRIWEFIEGWSCENLLKECINRNNLTKHNIVTLDTYYALLQFIKQYEVHDNSYKNILVEGVCHYQYPDKSIIKIC